ncbi:MAG: metallophosphoesterase [Eubacteriaceae bacterium]|nr:metallophosphoesterase [Eubacteriaceae bacterium]
MKILVISDTHTNTSALQKVIDSHPECELILHMGDGINDLRRVDRKGMGFVAVRGNCDRYETDEEEQHTVKIENIKIFMTHGHRYNVKSTKDLILAKSLRECADVCLFGHTHIAFKEYRNGVLMLNPGSLGYDGRYMIIDTNDLNRVEIFDNNM